MTYTTAFDLYVPDEAADARRDKKNAREMMLYQFFWLVVSVVAVGAVFYGVTGKTDSSHETNIAPGSSVSTTGWW